jgi:signal transduction histidine kinase
MAIAAGAVRLSRDASNQCELHRYLEGAIRRGGAIADSLTKLVATRDSTTEFDANETIRLLEPLFEAVAGRQVTVDLELHCSAPRVRACQTAFEAALLELVANARDAIAGRGRIRIRSVGIGRRLFVMVADTGTGMAGTFRTCGGFGSISIKANGTGTGLPQVRGFAGQDDGRLHIRSVTAHGTVIALNLPAVLKIAPPVAHSGQHPRRNVSAPLPEEIKHEERQSVAA